MGEKKKAGRPASYSAEYFPHMTNHDGETHIRHILKKWKLAGYSIYYMIMEKLGSAQHHYLQYSTEEDKLDLYDQLRPAEEKVIIEIIDYLITKQVLDKNLFEQGIIYSPFFVNTLSTLYSSRNCNPLIPEKDNKGNIIKRKVFVFSTEKYLYSTVNTLFQEENPANRTEDNNIETNLTKSDQPNSINSTTPDQSKGGNESSVDPVVGSDGRSDLKNQDSEKPVSGSGSVSAADRPSKPTEDVSDITEEVKKLNNVNNLYDERGNLKEREETGRNWNTIMKDSPFLFQVKSELNLTKEKTLSLYNQYGRERLLLCFADIRRKVRDPEKGEIKKPGLFIKSLEQIYNIPQTDEITEIINEIENWENEHKE